jgi:hypothetical protein
MNEKLTKAGMAAFAAVSDLVATAAKRLKSQCASIAAQFTSINKQNEDPVHQFSMALAPLQALNDRLVSTLKVNQDAVAHWAQQGAEFVQAIQRMVRDLPEHMRIACSELADQGWYIDGDFGAGAAGDLVRGIRSGNYEWVNIQLVDDYKQRLPAIKAALFERYPNRAKILLAAFRAHERGEYELSVPVFLAQADGICYDVTRLSMFLRIDGKPAVARYAESFDSDEFHAAVLTSIKRVHPIALSQKERPNDFNGLNRHQVLHGEAVNYDTELNSFKAISLLSYLEWVLRLDRNEAIGRREALRNLQESEKLIDNEEP